jgi:diphosphomevalonate decarboxylase
MTVQASAPSNIALIKYMGKIEGTGNQPTNSSLSWTLENLRSFVRITAKPELEKDQWAPLTDVGMVDMHLGEKSIARFLKHFENLKNEFGIQGHFLLESGNNFPSDCGLASSASSFAALTMAATEIFAEMGNEKAQDLSILEKAELSRKGSGSSCRSFFGPWALWFREGVRPLEFPMSPLLHQVIIVESEAKAVSSSEAHKRVTTSPLFENRTHRAEQRLANLIDVFRHDGTKKENWKAAFQIIWDEFRDMHQLFETSEPSFSYFTPGTNEVLGYLQSLWNQRHDGPLVTMDAGANVHLLYRQDQRELAREIEGAFAPRLKVYSSFHSGARL